MSEYQIGECEIPLAWLVHNLECAQKSAPWEHIPVNDFGECDGIDVRLQVFAKAGEAYFHTGDASYDQDHRGYWGASSVGRDDDRDRLVEIAKDLIDQAAEMFADDNRP